MTNLKLYVSELVNNDKVQLGFYENTKSYSFLEVYRSIDCYQVILSYEEDGKSSIKSIIVDKSDLKQFIRNKNLEELLLK